MKDKMDLLKDHDEGVHIYENTKKLVAAFAAGFILSGSFPVSAAEADRMTEDIITEQNSIKVHAGVIMDDASPSEMITVSGNKAKPAMENEAGFPIPDEAPPFHARIEFRMGYTVIGTFTEFTPDIIRIQTLCSPDGVNWQTSSRGDWNLFNLGTDDEDKLKGLQNQPCLFSGDEPLKSYIEGEIDRFYLKLRITKKNGLSYETQSAVIERGGIQLIPEGTERRACFSSSIAVREPSAAFPYRYLKYGRYQLTICADTTAEDISALLPDTLPVEVQLDHEPDFIALGVVDCPVTWKPLTLPRLSAGESITIPDAAEEILVPSGTLVSTPIGIFQLDEPLSLNSLPSTDEVRLVLNVIPEDRTPAGVLKGDPDGLKISLHQKPTGAVSIQAYVLTEGDTKWTELSGLSLLKEMNAQPSTENSGYALVLRNDQEPYRSYLEAQKAGTTPTPFFIGLKIEGGIYDDRQLILAWPDIYDELPDLPKVGGAEGNEGNAGANNKDDSTESGQRPNLAQIPDDHQEEQQKAPAPEDRGQKEQTLQITVPDDSSQNKQTPPAHEPDTNGISVANQEDILKFASLVMQFASDIKEAENIPALSDVKISPEHTAESNNRISLLPVITVIAAGGCIGTVVCKLKGHSPLHWIVRKLQNIMHQ